MNTQLTKALFHSNGGFAALVLRVPVGLVLAAHGAQKLFGWFGGYGLEGTGQWLASIVHIGNGLFMSNNGYEYALTLFVVTVALAIQGAGRFAVDNLFHKEG